MLKCMIDNICVMFSGRVFQHTAGISMDANLSPLLSVPLFVWAKLHRKKRFQETEKKLAWSFNVMFRHIYIMSFHSLATIYGDRIYPMNLK